MFDAAVEAALPEKCVLAHLPRHQRAACAGPTLTNVNDFRAILVIRKPQEAA